MEKIEEIQKFEYLASPEDIFHARVITSGIIEVLWEGDGGMRRSFEIVSIFLTNPLLVSGPIHH
jgi:hypothetical protein